MNGLSPSTLQLFYLQTTLTLEWCIGGTTTGKSTYLFDPPPPVLSSLPLSHRYTSGAVILVYCQLGHGAVERILLKIEKLWWLDGDSRSDSHHVTESIVFVCPVGYYSS